MINQEQIPIERKIIQKELTQKIKDLEKRIKSIRTLKFINYRYHGKSVDEAVALIGVTKRVGYICQERWNEEAIEGLKLSLRILYLSALLK